MKKLLQRLRDWWFCVNHGICPKHFLGEGYNGCYECGEERAAAVDQRIKRMKHAMLAILIFAAIAAVPPDAQSQNMSAVTAANITDDGGNKLAAGSVYFQATDSKGNHIPFQVGGGGQSIDRPACGSVINGAIVGYCGQAPGAFQVWNPASTIPNGIFYAVNITDGFSTVRTLSGVTWSGGTFNLDTYVPTVGNIGNPYSVDAFTVKNLVVTNFCTGCLSGLAQVNGVALNPFVYLNFVSGTGISISNPSQGNVRFDLVGQVPSTLASASHKWLKSYDSTTGLFTSTQPDYSDLTGTPQLPLNTGGVSHQFFSAYNSTTGAFTQAQAACADLSNGAASCSTDTTNASNISSGALAKARQHAATVYNDQANTFGAFLQKFRAGADFQLGDVTDFTKLVQFDLSNVSTATTRTVNVPDANSTLAQAFNAVSHQFLTDMSAQGLHHAAQPAFSDLTGSATCGQEPALTGDTTSSAGTCGTTTGKVNGVTYPAAPSANTVAVVTSAAGGGTTTYEGVPNAALANSSVTVPVTAPLGGGGAVSLGASASSITCITCATTTNGGPISGTSPIAISAGGAISVTGAAGQVPNGTTGAFTAQPVLGANGGTGGMVTLNGATSGSVGIWTPAASADIFGIGSSAGVQDAEVDFRNANKAILFVKGYVGADFAVRANLCLADLVTFYGAGGGGTCIGEGAIFANETESVPIINSRGTKLTVPPYKLTWASNLSATVDTSGNSGMVLTSCASTPAGCIAVKTVGANGFAVGNVLHYWGTEAAPLSDVSLDGMEVVVSTVTDSTHFNATPAPLRSGAAFVNETIGGGAIAGSAFQAEEGARAYGASNQTTSTTSTRIQPPDFGAVLVSNKLTVASISKVDFGFMYLAAGVADHGTAWDPTGMGNTVIHDTSFFAFKWNVENGGSCNTATYACYNDGMYDVNINPGGGNGNVHLGGAANGFTIGGVGHYAQMTGSGVYNVLLGGDLGASGSSGLESNAATQFTCQGCDMETQTSVAQPAAPTLGTTGGSGTTVFTQICVQTLDGCSALSTENTEANIGATNLTVTGPASSVVGGYGWRVFATVGASGTETEQTTASGSCPSTILVNNITVCQFGQVWTQSGAFSATTLAVKVLTAMGATGGAAFDVRQGNGVCDGCRFEANTLPWHTGPSNQAYLLISHPYNAGNQTGTIFGIDESGLACQTDTYFGSWYQGCGGISTSPAPNLTPNWSFEGNAGNGTAPFAWTSTSGGNFNTGSNVVVDNTAGNLVEGSYSGKCGNTGVTTLTLGCATPKIAVNPKKPHTDVWAVTVPVAGTKYRLCKQFFDSSGTLIQDANQTAYAVMQIGREGVVAGSSANLTYQSGCTGYQFGADIVPATPGTPEWRILRYKVPFTAASMSTAFEITVNGGSSANNFINVDALYIAEGAAALPPNGQTGFDTGLGKQMTDSCNGGTCNEYSNLNVPTGANYLVNGTAAATTPNGQTCALGGTCNVNTGAAAHSVALNQGNGAAMTGVGPGTTNQLLVATTSADPNYKSFGDLTVTDYVAGGGTAQAQTATLAPPITALTIGMEVKWLPAAANTAAAPTLAVNGLTAKPITKFGTVPLVANDLQTTQEADAIYDGTEYILLNPQTPTIAGIHSTGLTAAVSTATLCASAATACATAGNYHINWNFWGSGTACSSVTAGSVTFLLTWTDTNAVVHSAVALQMMSQTGAATEAMQSTFPFQTALANESASGEFNVSTNGAIIQYATGYTACTTGTGTYNLDVTVQRYE